MIYKTHFILLLGVSLLMTSCSNYGYLSDNDVYMQAPTEINLEENENELTSFNAFKAREKGAFKDEYRDSRINERLLMNQFMIFNAYVPFGTSYGMYANRPIGFHRMGMYDPFYPGYGFMAPSFGYSFSSGFGMEMYYMRFNNSYYAGNFAGYYNPYGYTNYGYNPYFNNGGSNIGNQNQTSPQVAQPVYYGNRVTLTSSSNRSSSYDNKDFSQVPAPSYNVNNQTLGTSRREVSRRYAGGTDYSNDGQPNKNNFKTNQSGYSQSTGVVHQRAVNQNYTPNSSARRSGTVQTQRSVNVRTTNNSSVRSSSSTQRSPSSYEQRSTPQSRGSISRGGATRSTSAPSSTRSSGSTNSSSGRR
jgi:hypothetical protein